MTEDWRKLHNQKHFDLKSQNITKVFQTSRMRMAGNVTHMGGEKEYIHGRGFSENIGK